MAGPDHPQSDLFGGASARPARLHRLFFALLPDAATRTRLLQAGQAIRAAHPDLPARWVVPQRHHVTVHFLGDHPSLRHDVVAAAMAAADRLSVDPFDWVLDEATSFHASQPPWILRRTEPSAPLLALWQGLRGALILAGQGRQLERQFSPHVTMAYGDGHALPPMAIEPLLWRVDSLVLLDSVSGEPDYRTLAQWSLRGGTLLRDQV